MIVCEATNITYEAEKTLVKKQFNVMQVIVMILTGSVAEEGASLLEKSKWESPMVIGEKV